MNLFTIIIKDLVLFSIIESFLVCKYFELFKCKKFNIKEILFIAIINSLISSFIPPILYQFIMIVWMGCFLYISKDKTLAKGLLISLTCVLFFMIVEMSIAMFYEKVLHLSFMNFNTLELFLAALPMKIIEFILINGGGNMKMWFGDIERRK